MSALCPSPAARLDALRAEIRALEIAGRQAAASSLPFGVCAIDRKLVGEGLVVAALHEICGAGSSLNDDAAATLFVAGIAARLGSGSGTVLWIRARRDLFAPALAQAGLPPHRVIYADCSRDEDVLAVFEEGLRHGGLAAVVGEVGRASMTATRRLQLAAEDSGTMALMLKRWRRNGVDPLALPSAASSRWRIGCVPSEALPASGIGRPRWSIDLVRQRGGPAHHWIMEGIDEAGRLALPAGPSHRSAAADRREAPVRNVA
ncbi:MAG: protein ImuA [Sphingomicrobium sp.]